MRFRVCTIILIGIMINAVLAMHQELDTITAPFFGKENVTDGNILLKRTVSNDAQEKKRKRVDISDKNEESEEIDDDSDEDYQPIEAKIQSIKNKKSRKPKIIDKAKNASIIICKLCPNKSKNEFETVRKLLDHMKDSHPGNNFPCHFSGCEEVYKNIRAFYQHIATIHKKERLSVASAIAHYQVSKT